MILPGLEGTTPSDQLGSSDARQCYHREQQHADGPEVAEFAVANAHGKKLCLEHDDGKSLWPLWKAITQNGCYCNGHRIEAGPVQPSIPRLPPRDNKAGK